MADPDSGVPVGPYSVLAVRWPFVVALPWDWLAALVFGSELDGAALDSQDLACAPAGEKDMPAEIGLDLTLA